MNTPVDYEDAMQIINDMKAYPWELRDLAKSLLEELVDVQKKLSEAESFIKAIADTCEHAERVAAESQSREKDTRDALLLSIESSSSWRYSDFLEARAKVLKLWGAPEDVQPTDDTALKQLLAAERERCYKVCEHINAMGFRQSAWECMEAIRALGDQP